MVIPLFNN